MTGERLSQAGWLGPSQAGSQGSGAEAGFTSPSGSVRALSALAALAVSKREEGTERPEAMRNRFEPSQAVQAGFEPGRVAVTQRVFGCYCASARAESSGGLREDVSQIKDAERRDKMSIRTGKDTRPRQDP